MDPADLERLVDGALKALTPPKAPPTLLSRVMAAVDARLAAPWYTRPWMTWPRVWQAASALSLFVLVAGLARVWALTEIARQSAVDRLMPRVPESLVNVVGSAAALGDALRIGWRLVAEPLVLPLAVFLCLMTAACMVFAAALNRVALGGASES